jgi:hypothetical protein
MESDQEEHFLADPLSVAFVGALVYANRELLPIWSEHLEELDGEVLPHAFMFQVERWTESQISRLGGVSEVAVKRVLGFLDAAIGSAGDETIAELLSVSFLEHLPETGELSERIPKLLGPHLFRALNNLRK